MSREHDRLAAAVGKGDLARLKVDELGAVTQLVEVVEETPRRYRIRAMSLTTIWGRRNNRFLAGGETTLVAKDRVSFFTSGEPDHRRPA